MAQKPPRSLLLPERYTPACGVCRHGKRAPDGRSVLCPHRGVMHMDSHCTKYQYDPMKRCPSRTPVLPDYDPELFSL